MADTQVAMSRDEVAQLIWNKRTEANVSIRIDINGNSRDLDRVLEYWLGTARLNRAEFESAIGALHTLRTIIGMPISN